ncbi:hypothetical protein LguiB_035098 [Lonicera macranthoides]
MRCPGVKPNSITFLGLLGTCMKSGDLGIGKLIQLYIIKKDIPVTENLRNGLLYMYTKFGDTYYALKLFHMMDVKTVCSWTSMICGFKQKVEKILTEMPEKDLISWNSMVVGYA